MLREPAAAQRAGWSPPHPLEGPGLNFKQRARVTVGIPASACPSALFRTYAVPSISGLLAETGEFERRPRKRYDDTELILAEMLENGLDSPRGRAALARMNAMHGRFPIANEDMLYVLSTFIFEPIRPDWGI